tara:strand:- start:3740 stop:4861 length:1122 start_codon:yes stop_codon:yes gene_type:complete
MKENKAYCPLPFYHLYNNGTGKYYLCCHTSETDNFTKDWNITDHLPFEFHNSEDMKKIRKDMLDGIYVKDCIRCYKQDQNNIDSPRKKYIKKFQRSPNKNKYELKLSIFGNYCNLSCAMCHPVHSSARDNEFKELNLEKHDWTFPGKQFRISNKRVEEITDNLSEHIQYINSIVISSDGEPLQTASVYNFLLNKISNYHASKIGVSITTNLNRVVFKKYHLNQILDKFKNVKLRVSADHIEEKYEWIRKNSDFNKLVVNIEAYKKYIMWVSPAISILNVNDLIEIKSFYNSIGVKCMDQPTTFSLVTSPSFLRPRFSLNKIDLYNKYKSFDIWKEVCYELQLESHPRKREMMFNYLDKLSLTRGDWRSLWKEL